MGLDQDARRLSRIQLDPRTIFNFLKTGKKSVEVDGIPMDAQFRGVSFDAPSGNWQLFVEHESFPHVPEYEVVPELTPRIKVIVSNIEE